ncbi:MAG: TetR/AcrR family transcriptional regulator [Pseudomonadales bacterium]
MSTERLNETSNKRVTQGQHTVRQVLAVARKAFAEQGFANTTTQQIIDAAGITKGALYHHFPSKADLFEAVYRDIEQAVEAQIAQASASINRPWDQLLAGCCAYLDAFQNADWYRILRIDGPAVLGQQQWAKIDAEHGLERLLPFLEFLAANRIIEVASVPAFARLLTGAMNEASFWIASADNKQAALAASKATLIAWLEGVRVT